MTELCCTIRTNTVNVLYIGRNVKKNIKINFRSNVFPASKNICKRIELRL